MVVPACGSPLGFEFFGAEELCAPPLMWAKTYDAEYLSLAGHLGCRLVTLDGRLRKGEGRLGFVIDPSEI